MEKPRITGTTHLLPFSELSPAQFERLSLWLVESEGYLHAEHLGEAGSEQGRDQDEAREHWGTAKEMVERMGYHRRDNEVHEIEEELD